MRRPRRLQVAAALAGLALSACAPSQTRPQPAPEDAVAAGPAVHSRIESFGTPVSAAARLVDKQIEAYNARDLEAFSGTWAENACLYTFPASEPGVCGLANIRPVYAKLFEENPGLRCRVIKRMVHGDYVFYHEHVSGLASDPDLYIVAIYQVTGGRIQNAWFLY